MAKQSGWLRGAAFVATALSLGACAHDPNGFGRGASLSDRECMARVMYFESNRSSEDGMLAVGTVVMNRLQSPKYPKTVCAVVGQSNQFAEGALTKSLDRRHSSWARADRVAGAVLAGQRHAGVGGAMFFHTAGYSFPYRNMRYVTLAGGNIFYDKRYPAPGAPAWPSSTMFAANASGTGAQQRSFVSDEPVRRSRPVLLASLDGEDGGTRGPLVLQGSSRAAAAPARPPAVARPPSLPEIEQPEVVASKPAAPLRLHPTTVVASAPAKAKPVMLASVRPDDSRAAAPHGQHRLQPGTAAAPSRPGARVAVAEAPPPKPRPIVLAMLSDQKARPLPPPRSIAALIEQDTEKRRVIR
ncbi:MAG: cell wall hydrolase [Enterovirga sp.]|nr:cell wall hydrolase [Enterovirga sp.]